jgi:hypothetical protein
MFPVVVLMPQTLTMIIAMTPILPTQKNGLLLLIQIFTISQ